jgi:hypothetical protein
MMTIELSSFSATEMEALTEPTSIVSVVPHPLSSEVANMGRTKSPAMQEVRNTGDRYDTSPDYRDHGMTNKS